VVLATVAIVTDKLVLVLTVQLKGRGENGLFCGVQQLRTEGQVGSLVGRYLKEGITAEKFVEEGREL
jgi:hypothetical protein